MIRQNVPLSCPSGVEINIKKKKVGEPHVEGDIVKTRKESEQNEDVLNAHALQFCRLLGLCDGQNGVWTKCQLDKMPTGQNANWTKCQPKVGILSELFIVVGILSES